MGGRCGQISLSGRLMPGRGCPPWNSYCPSSPIFTARLVWTWVEAKSSCSKGSSRCPLASPPPPDPEEISSVADTSFWKQRQEMDPVCFGMISEWIWAQLRVGHGESPDGHGYQTLTTSSMASLTADTVRTKTRGTTVVNQEREEISGMSCKEREREIRMPTKLRGIFPPGFGRQRG